MLKNFNTSNYIALAGVIFSAIALAKSFLTDRKLKKQQKEINRIQLEKYEEEQDEKRKACVVAICKTNKIVLQNKGVAIARNIRVDWNGLDKERGIPFIDTGILPYEFLNANDSFHISLVLADGKIETKIIKIIWDDDYTDNNSRNQAISLD